MEIILTVGHSRLKNGYYTSADGRPFGGVLEYEYNKNIVNDVASYLRGYGHTVDVLICPEKQFTMSTEEKAYKLSRVNAGGYDIVCELHLNASKWHNVRGCSVLYKTNSGKKYAQHVQKQLSTVFRDIGIVKRDDLYMLNGTKPTAIMLETFFCDNYEDCKLAEKNNIPLLIAKGIHGFEDAAPGIGTSEQGDKETEASFRFRTIVQELTIRKDAGVENEEVGKITDKLVYTIVETKKAKDGGTWGRLKSGAGWVNVSPKYINRV